MTQDPKLYEMLEKQLREQFKPTPEKLAVIADDVLATSLAILASSIGMKDGRLEVLAKKIQDTLGDPNMLLLLALLSRKALLQEAALTVTDELIQGDREA